MNRVSDIFAIGMVDRVTASETFTDRHEGLRFIAQELRVLIYLRFDHTFRCPERETGDDGGSRIASRRPVIVTRSQNGVVTGATDPFTKGYSLAC